MAKQITTIGAEAKQSFSFILDNSKPVAIELQYIDSQLAWFMNINYNSGEHIINGIRIVSALNLLSQYAKILPFGITISMVQGFDPFNIDDFVKGRATFYIMSIEEIDGLKQTLYEV